MRKRERDTRWVFFSFLGSGNLQKPQEGVMEENGLELGWNRIFGFICELEVENGVRISFFG